LFGKSFSLSVGISTYGGGFNNLNFADDDARNFNTYFNTKFFNKADGSRGYLITNQIATKKNILRKLKNLCLAAGKNDKIFFYYSGHGNEGGLIPSDFASTNQTITFDEIRTVLASSKAKLVMVILDACYSGKFRKDSWSRLNDLLFNQNIQSKAQTRVAFVSSRPDQTSIESATTKGGLFTYFLLQGLEGKSDADKDGYISIKEIYAYVRKYSNAEMKGQQIPMMFGNFNESALVATY
jgi:uncharacterized caspase-like protein